MDMHRGSTPDSQSSQALRVFKDCVVRLWRKRPYRNRAGADWDFRRIFENDIDSH